jgi:hypothetical protein
MKKLSFLVLAVFVFSASRIQAQGFHLGIKAGTNISEINGRSFSDGFKFGFSAGAFAELNFTSQWGIQPELLFNQSTSQTASSFNTIIPNGINNQTFNLDYLSIPILLSYKPIPLLSLQLGPQFGILMSTSETVVGNGEKAFKSGDFSMVGGAQVNIGGFKGGARYVLGLTNLNAVNDADSWKNEGFQLYVGFRIF